MASIAGRWKCRYCGDRAVEYRSEVRNKVCLSCRRWQ